MPIKSFVFYYVIFEMFKFQNQRPNMLKALLSSVKSNGFILNTYWQLMTNQCN
jgi:hypothetical protein